MAQQMAIDPIQLRLDRYRALLQVSVSIALNRLLPDLIRDLSVRLRDAVQFDYINLMLHDPERDVLRVQALETPLQSIVPVGFEMSVDDSPAGEVWKTQRPFIVDNVDAEHRYPQLFQILRERNIKAYCSLPLTSPVRRLGTLSFGSLNRNAYPQEDIEFLQQVARQVAVAVDNALHYQDAQTYQRDLGKERDRLRLLLQ